MAFGIAIGLGLGFENNTYAADCDSVTVAYHYPLRPQDAHILLLLQDASLITTSEQVVTEL